MKNDAVGSRARQFASYFPRLQRNVMARRTQQVREPSALSLVCANMMVDIVGFTSLAERLAGAGLQGAEQLSGALNIWFSAMFDIIHAHGGDVWIIAGDSAHVIWPVSEGEGLEEAVARAAQCALEVQRRMPEVQAQGASLRLRAAVGAGPVSCYELGGVNGRWVPLLTGEPILQVSRGTQVATPGDVIVSPEAWKHLEGRAQGESREGGQVRLDAVRRPVPLPGAPQVEEVGEAHLETLRSYLLSVVAERLMAGQTDYLAEFRTVSVMFLHLSSLDNAPVLSELAVPQQVLSLVQEQLQRFEGTLYQLLRDEKGTTLVAAFGLPPLAHDDDGLRAVEAARLIREGLAVLGQKAGIGIATGNVFCGAYGHPARLQYSLVGTTMNLAARLMQATGGNGLLCDQVTFQAAGRGLHFEELERLSVKGFQAPVRVFRPEGRREQTVPVAGRMLGRERERQQLDEQVRRLKEQRQGGVCLIRAEAGLGKSKLMAALRSLAREQAVTMYQGAAESLEAQTPYYSFRSVVAGWLGLPREPRAAELAPHLEAWLRQHHPDLVELAPLLGAVLSVELPDNALTGQMTGQERADNLHRLLVRLAGHVAAQAPSLLLLEDAHWLDSISWALLRLLVEQVPGMLVAVSLRPLAEPPAELQALLAAPGTTLLELRPLEASDIFELLCAQLGVRSLPAPVQSFILEKGEGNPFYSEQLALALRDAGLLDTTEGRCTLVGGEEALARATFPGTLSGIVTSRIDRMQPQLQLTLKVASIVGRVFEGHLVHGIHPLDGDRTEVPHHLLALSIRDFISAKEEQGTPAWSFRHAVIHETTYGLLPFALRRTLHRATAEYLERVYSGDLTPVYALLAHHWVHAEVLDKAVVALARAGEQALKVYANQECIAFLTKALELDARARPPAPMDLQRSRWHRLLAEAYYSLSRYAQARHHAEQCLLGLGMRVPTGERGLLWDLTVHLLRRLGLQPRPPEQAERHALALESLELLSVCFGWQNMRIAQVHSALLHRNLAEEVGESPQLAGSHAQIGYLLGLLGLRGVGERELREGAAMAEATGSLRFQVACNVLWGMHYTLRGQLTRALEPLRYAEGAMQRLNGGLWRHRPKFMLAEALLCLAKYPEAREAFVESGKLSVGAEEHAVGMASAMVAYCHLQQGRPKEALRLLEGKNGLPHLRKHPVAMSVFICLGVLAETRLRLGEVRAALESLEEAEALLASGNACDDYFLGTLPHAMAAEVYLELWERVEAGTQGLPERAWLRERARAACKRLGKLVRLYPGAGPRHALVLGRLHALEGHAAKARDAFERALELALDMEMPYEQGRAHHELGRLTSGAESIAQLQAARQVFERLDLPWHLERTRSSRRD